VLRNPYIAGVIIAICVAALYLENRSLLFGKLINRITPCAQDPSNSFPCFGMYDIAAMAVLVAIGLFFAGVLLYGMLRHRFDTKRLRSTLLLLGIALLVSIVIPMLASLNVILPSELASYGLKSVSSGVDTHLGGHPIDSGYDPQMLMGVYPGLVPADFDDAEATQGWYFVSGGGIEFHSTAGTRVSTAEKGLTSDGIIDVLQHAAARLSMSLSSEADIDALLSQLGTIAAVLSSLSLPDLTLKGWYAHRESNVNILFLRQKIVPEIGMSELPAYGEYIYVNSLPIEMTPEEWVADRQLETDLANKYEWDFLNGRRHLRVTHPTPAADAQTDYFFGYGHVVIAMFYPVSTLKNDPLQRTDYEVFLYNSIAPLVDTAYSRDVLRKNCAEDVPTASIDDSSADPENHIVTFYWWDGTLQDNRKLDVLYEPETNFAGCSESVKSILEHVRDIDESNRESGFYRYTNTNLGFSIDQPAEVYFMGEKDGVVAFSLLSPNDLRQASSIGLVNALTITSAQISPGEGTESKVNGERVVISSTYGAYGGEQHWSYFFPDHNLLIQHVEKKPIYEQMIGTIRFE